MVDFNVRTYSEDDGRIIGAEVTVISTSGDNHLLVWQMLKH